MTAYVRTLILLNLLRKINKEDKTLNKTLFNVLLTKNYRKMMKREKTCKYCLEIFEARRSNHVYCNTSCKTKASYERNNYKYVSGHYQNQEVSKDLGGLNVLENSTIIESIKLLDQKIDSIQKTSNNNGVFVAKSALGSVVGDVAVYGVKKVFAPNTIPATKGDVIALRNELNELKKMIQSLNTNQIQFL